MCYCAATKNIYSYISQTPSQNTSESIFKMLRFRRDGRQIVPKAKAMLLEHLATAN